MAIDIDVNSITSNIAGDATTNWVITGDGIFDKLMIAFNAHINAQYQLDRLKGADYATVYLGGVQAAMTTAMQLEIEAKKLKLEKIPSGRS